jgi:urease accessory protein
MKAAEDGNVERLVFLNDLALASRETKELRLTDTAMGEALLRLLKSLEFEVPVFKGSGPLNTSEYSFAVLFGFACTKWEIPYEMAANGFLWSWLENQVAAATKLVPLGQTQAQQLLTALQSAIGDTMALSESVSEDDIGGGLPGMAIASALHERQYSRLFRS